MAKNESTAVNELIELASLKPVLGEEDDGLFSSQNSYANSKTAPRPSGPSPVPAMSPRPADVAQAPLLRAPSGTQTNIPPAPAVARTRTPTVPPATPPAKLTTISPSSAGLTLPRPATLPPLPNAASRPRSSTGIKLPTAAQGTPAPELFSRTGSGTTLPPPMPRTPAATPPAASPPAVAAPYASTYETAEADGWAAPGVTPAPALPATALPALPQAAPRARSAQHDAVPVAAQGVDVELGEISWFEQSRAVDKVDEMLLGTQQVQRQRPTASLMSKLALPLCGVAIIGVFIGGYVAFNGEGPKATAKPAKPLHVAAAGVAQNETAPIAAAAAPTVAPIEPAVAAPAVAAPAVAAPAVAAPVEPAPAPQAVTPPNQAAPAVAAAAPVAAPAVVAAPIAAAPVAPNTVTMTDVRIDSQPAGATVMLVDRGQTSFLGTTPVSASVDPSRTYDVVLTLAGRPTQVEHLDPAATTHLAIVLGRPGNAAAPTAPAKAAPAAQLAAAPAKHPTHHDAPAQVAAVSHAPAETHHTAPKQVAAAEPSSGGGGSKGVLMISSKPPCQILIDGKSTGLMTPQRAISLSAGGHKITLVNAGANIKQTFPVQIAASKSTKLIENLMAK